jgi:hypothetical protein
MDFLRGVSEASVPLVVVTLLMLSSLLWLFRLPLRSRFRLIAEVRLYAEDFGLPSQDDVMKRLLAADTRERHGLRPLQSAEGLVLSDVRLRISWASRDRNPKLFDPARLTAEGVSEHIPELARARGVVILRYVSPTPVPGQTHLSFLVHAAEAYATLADAHVLLDVQRDRMMTVDEFLASARETPDLAGAQMHIDVTAQDDDDALVVKTKGLEKVGHADLVAMTSDRDFRTILTLLLEQAVDRLWKLDAMPRELDIEAFGDHFLLRFIPRRNQPTQVRVLRVSRR